MTPAPLALLTPMANPTVERELSTRMTVLASP